MHDRLRACSHPHRSQGDSKRLASFEAVARGEARPDRDADVLVRFVECGTADDRYLDLAELLWIG